MINEWILAVTFTQPKDEHDEHTGDPERFVMALREFWSGSTPEEFLADVSVEPENRTVVACAELIDQLVAPATWAMMHTLIDQLEVRRRDSSTKS